MSSQKVGVGEPTKFHYVLVSPLGVIADGEFGCDHAAIEASHSVIEKNGVEGMFTLFRIVATFIPKELKELFADDLGIVGIETAGSETETAGSEKGI